MRPAATTSILLLSAALLAAGCTAAPTAAPQLPPAASKYSCLTDDQLRAGLVSFDDQRGGRLDGYLEGQGESGIVLAHQRGGDLCEWQPHQAAYTAAGYRTISFNTNGALSQNTLAAIAELRRYGVRNVYLIGASAGGGAVLEAAAQSTPPVAAVIALSPVETPDTVLARLTQPVLFLASTGDFDFAHASETMRPKVTTGGTELELLPGRTHGVAMLDRPTLQRTLDFLAAHRTI